MPGLSDEAALLIKSLGDAPSLLQRVRGHDPRRECLARLTALGDYRVVPQLLRFFAAADSLSEEVARSIAWLVRGLAPAELSWVDVQARSYSCVYGGSDDAWWTLSPADVQRLAGLARAYPAAVGLVASHPSGYVREAALKALGTFTTGEEIPFLAMRANDWAWPVAVRAGELLQRRLVADNAAAVMTALPFIMRMWSQHRQDHSRVSDALRNVLVADGGRSLLSRIHTLDPRTRRFVYELVGADTRAADRVLPAALSDDDSTVRRSAIRRLVAMRSDETSTPVLEDLLLRDRGPGVRKEALTVLAERTPDRARQLLPRALVDRAARVRETARFLVRHLGAAVVPRDVYVAGLTSASPRTRAAAIAGLGESGTRADADLLTPFLRDSAASVQVTALRATTRLDSERGLVLALAALADARFPVRAAVLDILGTNARRVDLGAVVGRLGAGAEPRLRKKLLSLAREAAKWDAAVLLLEMLGDEDDEIRALASRSLDGWLETFNRTQTPPRPTQLDRIGVLLDANGSRLQESTAREIRFILKP